MSNRIRLSLLLGVVAVAGLVGLLTSPAGASPTSQGRRFWNDLAITAYNSGAGLSVDQIGSGSILDLKDGSTSEYTFDQSSATFLNALTLSGGEVLTGHLAASTAAPVAGVASTAIALGGLLQPVSMATAGTVPITIPSAGRIICIYNTGSQSVTLDDSGNQVLAGGGTPVALGQYDTICGFSDGTRFIELMRSNN